jgi:predicted nucleic acid-binding Zn ribbon protein
MPGMFFLAGRSLYGYMLPGADAGRATDNFGPGWLEVAGVSGMEARELTRAERAAIRKLVTGMCANYDHEYGCLPLGCPCYMLGKWWTGSYCKYFRDAVLPLDPALEAALTVLGNSFCKKTCPVCGASYIPATSQAYCSEACRIKGKREADRRRQQRHRRKNNG